MQFCMWPSRDANGAVFRSVWQLAHGLHAHESLVQEWRSGQSFREVATGADRAHQDRSLLAGLDLGESASRRNRRVKKNDRRPLANPAADGTPRFIWLPRMLERP